jgi:hypothetical protein
MQPNSTVRAKKFYKDSSKEKGHQNIDRLKCYSVIEYFHALVAMHFVRGKQILGLI